MNLIQRLFGRRHPESAPSPFIMWPGQSGKDYQYEIYPIDTAFRPLPGNYIYARQDETGNWIPLYVAQTRDMHQRLEGHEKLQDSVEAGATHIHIHYTQAGQASRCSEEHDLVERWAPQCNAHLESS
jgi:hypothetical protein